MLGHNHRSNVNQERYNHNKGIIASSGMEKEYTEDSESEEIIDNVVEEEGRGVKRMKL